MVSSIKKRILIAALAFSLSACSGQGTPDPVISTAVAQTVAAQNAGQSNTETPAAPSTPIVTQTPLQFLPTLTPITPAASPTLPGNTQKSTCAKASLVSETIVDGQIFRPGEKFTKTWEIQNLSPCTWDTSYKIIFWNGNVLGGGFVYNLPQITPPQGIIPISLVLTAPTVEGSYTSEWVLQTPDGVEFGVGEYSVAFYAEIVVSDDKKPGYTITKVEYDIIRDPATGCPANVTYTVIANVTTNGPFEFSYYWTQKDGNDSSPKPVEVKEAGTKTFKREWRIGRTATPGDKWIEFHVSDPFQQDYGKAAFSHTCGQQ